MVYALELDSFQNKGAKRSDTRPTFLFSIKYPLAVSESSDLLIGARASAESLSQSHVRVKAKPMIGVEG